MIESAAQKMLIGRLKFSKALVSAKALTSKPAIACWSATSSSTTTALSKILLFLIMSRDRNMRLQHRFIQPTMSSQRIDVPKATAQFFYCQTSVDTSDFFLTSQSCHSWRLFTSSRCDLLMICGTNQLFRVRVSLITQLILCPFQPVT